MKNFNRVQSNRILNIFLFSCKLIRNIIAEFRLLETKQFDYNVEYLK